MSGSLLALESRSLGVLRKRGGKFHPNLNITQRPIAEKYCEGKLKRIAKAKLKVPEIVSREPFGGSGALKMMVDLLFFYKGKRGVKKRMRYVEKGKGGNGFPFLVYSLLLSFIVLFFYYQESVD